MSETTIEDIAEVMNWDKEFVEDMCEKALDENIEETNIKEGHG